MLDLQNITALDDEQIKRIRALVDPLRMKICIKLHEPMTITELAKSLGVDRHSLYYHIKVLLKADLIEKVETHQVGHLVESVYKATDFKLQHRPEAEPVEVYQSFILNDLQQTIEDFYKAMERHQGQTHGGGGRLVLKINSENYEAKLDQFKKLSFEFFDRMKELEDKDGDMDYLFTVEQFIM